jgi:hypothetical protein
MPARHEAGIGVNSVTAGGSVHQFIVLQFFDPPGGPPKKILWLLLEIGSTKGTIGGAFVKNDGRWPAML